MATPTTPFYFSLLLASLIAPMADALAQVGALPAPVPEGRLVYIGDSAQLSAGLSHNAKLYGELSGVMHETPTQTWLGEGWVGLREGGIKLSHHRHTQIDRVDKLFFAFDKNRTNDQKITYGYGLERHNWFSQFNISHSITGKRLVSQQQITEQSQNTGQVDGSPYIDTTTHLLNTQIFEKAYDHGIGLRFGHHFENLSIRLTAGLDHEWGQQQARLNTTTLIAEKIYPGTPHSIAVQVSHSKKSGFAEPTRNDTRTLLIYRHSFGNSQNSRPERLYQLKPVVQAVPSHTTPIAPTQVLAPPLQDPLTRIEKQWVKTKVSMSADAFFEFNSARINPNALAELQRVAQLLQAQGREGPIQITGHTCDIGSDQVNDRLSLSRAQAVKNQLIGLGVVTQADIISQGRGKRAQKFPATAATRSQNRRVELEFFSFVDQESLVEITVPAPIPEPLAFAPPPILPPAPAVTFEREVVAQPPAWIQRALRSPTQHKRSVSVYRFQETSRTESTQRKWINQAPTARNDAYTLESGSTTALDVMVNDSDPDNNDTITLVQVSAPTHGQVSTEGRQITYRAAANYIGPDSFNYTIEDSKGLQSTAQVNLTLHKTAPVNRAPVAQADQYTAFVGSSSDFNVLDNDSDPDANDTIRLFNVSAPAHGQVSIKGRQVIYRASATHVGPDSFSYTIEDSKGLQATAQVKVVLKQIESANRAPVAQADQYTAFVGSTSAFNVLDNDSDPDAKDTLRLLNVSAPTHGQVNIEGRQVIYRASANHIGLDSFSYTIEDSKGLQATAQVGVLLAQANRAPQANADHFGISGKNPSLLAVLDNDTDPDGDTLVITSVTQPIANSGKVEITRNAIYFTPNYPFLIDWFTYTISDGRGGTSTATVRLVDP